MGTCKFAWRIDSLSIPFTWGFVWCLFALRRRKWKNYHKTWFECFENKQKVLFFLWLWANCSFFQISGFWLHFFFIYFQVDVMAYGENLFNLLFLLKKLFFPNFSSISLWSLILVLAYLGIKNVCNFFVCEVFQIWEVMLNDHLPKMIYPHFNSTYDKNCIISRDAWYNNLIHLLSIALPINIQGSMFRWKHFQLKTNKPAKRC